MYKKSMIYLIAALLLSVAAPLQAQSGCTDSPENPTIVLALVGSAGALLSTARYRWNARRRTPLN